MSSTEATAQPSTGSRKQLFAWLALAVVLVLLAPFVIFGFSYAATDVPSPEELENNQIAVIYDRTGENELARIVPEAGNREAIDLDEVPVQVRNAVLAAEDREFYTNPGFSISGYARAAWGAVTGDRSAGGGSTITQQYVKNAVVGNERTLTRKAKELVMAAKMARQWSKDEILEAYLNTIYFGRNAYGISAAAEAYFDKPINELSTTEGAVLAASIQRPSALDPWTNRPEAEQRWNYVLNGMVEMGVLDSNERSSMSYPETIDPASVPAPAQVDGPEGLIRNQVISELNDEGISETEVNTQGLRITTTIDPTVQNAALQAVDSYVDKDNGQRSAVVSIDPTNGAVRAYYGGDDPNGWDYANSGLQTGSTFKIFALAAALDQDIPLSKMYSSAPVQTGNVTVTNVGGETCGTCPISEALRRSMNTPFIRLQNDLKRGPDDTAAMAHRLGVAESIPGVGKTLVEENGHTLEGVTLGQYQTRPLDMASGLSTLVDNGVYHKPHFVQKVETNTGEVLLDRGKDPVKGDQRVSKAVATNVIDAMKPIAAYSNQALSGGRQSAAKTGTTQLGDTGLNKDAWMIGATPQLATAVWMGMVDGSALYNSWGGVMYGAQGPGSIWKYVMDNGLIDEDFESFDRPEAVAGQAGRPSWGGGTAYTPPATTVAPEPETTESTPEPAPVEPAEPVVPGLPEIPGLPIPGLPGGDGGGDGGGGAGDGGGAPEGGGQ
ncbi:penicillin-binding protein [Corynebacterium sp. TAE3-ERU12]|uniref:transglycosylase domain-containing protein n=1 Tax=Corynebacterium sp. TAE3-ERU12 TaxID=2849491 RepID=UPI001C46508E|nr:transglycosylase domain-containing protein [Corynebacterium sp. TAE3-ERU12]MBV7294320.1 penicillin-binding protein [Corynebacterium sp. TAE3-ERU12]